jgi:hypothetical protein
MGFLVKHRDSLKRGLVLCMCLLVFVFALQPRINFHGKGFVTKVQLRERTKLRPEAKITRVDLPVVVASWLATNAAYFLMFRGQPVMQRILVVLAPRDVMPQYHRQTFLRPPPVFSH